ncbi:thiamine-phosphate kinase [uncultured Methanobrevibacter sp.]|uniref:thiamine-phosphate kinase n=1 Tax=uncultured Methanobrevibacter sp. TaxID=253161 RepID=UPI0025D3827A|nr:thiamine-phosphate kinase [uncultured Methanobrevibacter sp.]
MKSSQIKVSELGEKQLIERIIQKSKSCSIYKPSDFNDFDDKTSIGDDSALTNVNIDDNSYLVSSSDMLIQSSHFPKAMTHFQMGYKSVVVNVSDLASMGAENIGFLLNLAIPKDTLLDDFDELVCGVIQACDNYNIPLIGGDTNEASEIIISGTAIGQVDKERALMKYGFEIGDLLCISGELAYAALGFELLKLIEENPKSKEIIEKIKSIDSTLIDLAILKALKPEAKYKEGHILRDYNTNNNRITATDITDGLASELYEILSYDKKHSQSDKIDNDSNSDNTYEKGIRIYEDKLPVEDEFKEIANSLGLNYLDLFLHVGEDFELLFTINKELKDKLSSDMNYYVIGEITDNNTVEIVLSNGNIEKISSRGYEHLK